MIQFHQLVLIKLSLLYRTSKYIEEDKDHSYVEVMNCRFKANPVKEVIRNVLTEQLAGKSYDSDNAKKWTISIANDVNTKVRGINI